jgi:hypothetical protein
MCATCYAHFILNHLISVIPNSKDINYAAARYTVFLIFLLLPLFLMLKYYLHYSVFKHPKSVFFFNMVDVSCASLEHDVVGSSPVSYSGGLRFKSHFRDQLSWFKFFIVFFSLCWQMLGYYPKLRHDHSLHTHLNLLFTIILSFGTI